METVERTVVAALQPREGCNASIQIDRRCVRLRCASFGNTTKRATDGPHYAETGFFADHTQRSRSCAVSLNSPAEPQARHGNGGVNSVDSGHAGARKQTDSRLQMQVTAARTPLDCKGLSLARDRLHRSRGRCGNRTTPMLSIAPSSRDILQCSWLCVMLFVSLILSVSFSLPVSAASAHHSDNAPRSPWSPRLLRSEYQLRHAEFANAEPSGPSHERYTAAVFHLHFDRPLYLYPIPQPKPTDSQPRAKADSAVHANAHADATAAAATDTAGTSSSSPVGISLYEAARFMRLNRDYRQIMYGITRLRCPASAASVPAGHQPNSDGDLDIDVESFPFMDADAFHSTVWSPSVSSAVDADSNDTSADSGAPLFSSSERRARVFAARFPWFLLPLPQARYQSLQWLNAFSEPEWLRGNPNATSSTNSVFAADAPTTSAVGGKQRSQTQAGSGSNVLSFLLLLRAEHTYAPNVKPAWLAAAETLADSDSKKPGSGQSGSSASASAKKVCTRVGTEDDFAVALPEIRSRFLARQRAKVCQDAGLSTGLNESVAAAAVSTPAATIGHLQRLVRWSEQPSSDGSVTWKASLVLAETLEQRRADQDVADGAAGTCGMHVLLPEQQGWVQKTALGGFTSPFRPRPLADVQVQGSFPLQPAAPFERHLTSSTASTGPDSSTSDAAGGADSDASEFGALNVFLGERERVRVKAQIMGIILSPIMGKLMQIVQPAMDILCNYLTPVLEKTLIKIFSSEGMPGASQPGSQDLPGGGLMLLQVDEQVLRSAVREGLSRPFARAREREASKIASAPVSGSGSVSAAATQTVAQSLQDVLEDVTSAEIDELVAFLEVASTTTAAATTATETNVASSTRSPTQSSSEATVPHSTSSQTAPSFVAVAAKTGLSTTHTVTGARSGSGSGAELEVTATATATASAGTKATTTAGVKAHAATEVLSGAALQAKYKLWQEALRGRARRDELLTGMALHAARPGHVTSGLQSEWAAHQQRVPMPELELAREQAFDTALELAAKQGLPLPIVLPSVSLASSASSSTSQPLHAFGSDARFMSSLAEAAATTSTSTSASASTQTGVTAQLKAFLQTRAAAREQALAKLGLTSEALAEHTYDMRFEALDSERSAERSRATLQTTHGISFGVGSKAGEGAPTPGPVPQILIKLLIKELSSQMTASITNAMADSVAEAVVDKQLVDMRDFLNENVVRAVSRLVVGGLSNTIPFTVPTMLQRYLPVALTHSLTWTITNTVTRAVTHTLAPTLAMSLSRPSAEQYACSECYYHKGYCQLCSWTPRKRTVLLLQTDYLSDYYSDTFSDHFTGGASAPWMGGGGGGGEASAPAPAPAAAPAEAPAASEAPPAQEPAADSPPEESP